MATITYVPTNPTIRINILTARFIVLVSLRADPLGAGTLARRELYRRPERCPKEFLARERLRPFSI